MPEWYLILRAAKYLGVAPWELAGRPSIWMRWALAAESAEAKAQEAQIKRSQRRRK